MNERSETIKSGSLLLLDVVVIAFVIIGFVSLLNFYGYALLPYTADEICFLQPAQNLAEGKGMGTPVLDDLLPGISQRTYWQPPVYFLVLAVWGKLVGFDVMSSRLLSRVCGVGILLLLWLLALRWGICPQLALVCVIWTALDLTFQYNSNLGRMDTMNAFWLMACLLAFTEHQRGGKIWQAAAAGFFGALGDAHPFHRHPFGSDFGTCPRLAEALARLALVLVSYPFGLEHVAHLRRSRLAEFLGAVVLPICPQK
jgi:4-amino-4-deoxy-L-arabinose transferase-like glycosyltransferase